ncbi:DUF4328 domain-containing protein [Streptomyces xantholiticus]|uniref:DUF4328 domain-containing protein n=1 Tax=Streptomyces xantholiticus TaxID=68285 RepID=UPI001675E0F0|nr:DUF4328 domain-containing protein [Streptomyces xantholiticus]GGW40968.1 hypothetical protein GCM10010381_27210 [Streptomyces xantholiticus]
MAVSVALGLNIGFAVALLAAQMQLHAVLGRMPQGEPVLRAEMWVGNLGGIQAAAFVGTGILFLLWFSQMRGHSERLRPSPRWMGRNGALGWWFVPVVNLWMPFRIALDIWASSQPEDTVRRRSRLPVTVWWLLFASWTFANGWPRDLYQRAEGADLVRAALRSGMIANGLCVVAAVATIVFVRQFTQMQSRQSHGDTSAAL